MEQTAPFTGVWDVTHATLPDGTFAYTGTITIRPLGELFALEWDISAGRYVGLGMLAGDHLLVACGEQWAGLGLAHYKREADGAVAVTWSSPDVAGATASGRFAPSIGDSFVGTHEVIHHLWNGQQAGAWDVEIVAGDGLYDIIWRKNDVIHWRGLGLDAPDGLFVAWYPDIKQLALLDYTLDPADPNTIHARWALGGYQGLGTETIVKRSIERRSDVNAL